MEFNLFGFKTRIEVIVACLLLGSFIGTSLFCSCVSMPKLKESFENLGSDLGYMMGNDIDNSVTKSKSQNINSNVICQKNRQLYDVLF
jgi:hypothetical protein